LNVCFRKLQHSLFDWFLNNDYPIVVVIFVMLINSKRKKPAEIIISKKQWKDLMIITNDGIKKKLNSARKLVDIDKEISAGLYTYAIEEFGKMILLNKSRLGKGGYVLKYSSEFIRHERKFPAAFDYLQENRYERCYVLNNKGGFTPEGFSWRSFTIGLLTDFEARLSVFYSDLVYDDKRQIVLAKIPEVDREMLRKAIDELQVAVDHYFKAIV
jgi:hypothetical protein